MRRSLALLLLVVACDPLARVDPARERPPDLDVGTTIPNDPVVDLDTSTPSVGDTDLGGDTDVPVGELPSSLSAGGQFTCASSDGVTSCWGMDEQDQATPPSTRFVEVAAGFSHACGLGVDGQIACWGDPSNGRTTPPSGTFLDLDVGTNTTCAVDAANAVHCWGVFSTPAGLPAARGIAVGATFGCLIGTDGTVGCFGSGPALEGEPTGNMQSVDAGDAHACALNAAGALRCWGRNDALQLDAPVGSWLDVSAGGSTTCGVTAGGALACWGANGAGQATPPGGSDWTDVTVGPSHACARALDGHVACWGDNASFQATAPILDGVKVQVGAKFGCALRRGGELACFGLNDIGQTAVPTPPGGATWADLAVGARHACAVTTAGDVLCWGADTRGQATVPATGAPWALVAALNDRSCATSAAAATRGILTCWPPPSADLRFTQIDGGWFHGCGVDADGEVACWGSSSSGEAVAPSGTEFTWVDAGASNTCGIAKGTSQVRCWGADTGGKNDVPANYAGREFSRVSTGSQHTCAIERSGGAVRCWGTDVSGDTHPPAGAFVEVNVNGGAVGGVDAISCGVETGGRVRCWGTRAL